MNRAKILLPIVAVLLIGSYALPEDWNKKLETMCKECEFVILGRVTHLASYSSPDSKTVSIATLQVRRYLMGLSDEKTIEVKSHSGGALHIEPDREEFIWFLRKKMDNGRYLVADVKWGKDSLGLIRGVIARVDKQTRIPNMPRPTEVKGPITVSLAADDGEGKALTSVKANSLLEISLLVQFENYGESLQSVMPCLDGSVVHWRYPYYDLEIIDANGETVPSKGVGRCGNVNPLHAEDIIPLQPGEVFRTWVPTYYAYNLTPGKYKVRLNYTAKRNVSTEGIPLGPNDSEVKKLINTVWEGTAVSDLIDVEILSKEAEK